MLDAAYAVDWARQIQDGDSWGSPEEAAGDVATGVEVRREAAARNALASPPPELRGSTEALRLRAVARIMTDDRDGAMQDLEAVLAADPSDLESRQRLDALREEASRR